MPYFTVYFGLVDPPERLQKLALYDNKPGFFGPFLENPHFTLYFGRFTPSRRHFRIPHEISVLPSYLEVWKSKFDHFHEKTPKNHPKRRSTLVQIAYLFLSGR